MTIAVPRPIDPSLLVTPRALDRLRAELAELRRQRPELLAAVTSGFAGGDAADQAAYVEQVEGLDALDARIAALEARIVNAVVVDPVAGAGEVRVGSVVTVRFAGDTDTERYVVGGADLADDDVSAVSPESPMGRALLGATPGATVSFAAPRGRVELTVVDC